MGDEVDENDGFECIDQFQCIDPGVRLKAQDMRRTGAVVPPSLGRSIR
jgi:hypothetical protein